MTTAEKIADTRRQLNAPNISPCRKRDLSKYLERLYREQRRELYTAEKVENKAIQTRNGKRG